MHTKVYQEYKCDCGQESGPSAPRICRLCYGICKPYTLNKDNRILNLEMGIPGTTSFEHTGNKMTGPGSPGDEWWGRVDSDWDNGFCRYFLKPEFFTGPQVEQPDENGDNDDGGDSGSDSWVTADEGEDDTSSEDEDERPAIPDSTEILEMEEGLETLEIMGAMAMFAILEKTAGYEDIRKDENDVEFAGYCD